MGRHRKSEWSTERVLPAVHALLICFFVGTAAIGYVYQKNQLNRLTRQIDKLEGIKGELLLQSQELDRHLSELHSPARLKREIERRGLDLREPDPRQMVFLPEDPGPDSGSDGAGQLARQGGGHR